jgi:hypothetical protein
MLHPRILEAYVHEPIQLPQYGDAFFQQNNYVGRHEDMRHDEISLGIETKC